MTVPFPAPLLDELKKQPDFDADAFLRAHTLPPPVSVRLHAEKSNAVNTQDWRPVPWCTNGFYLPERPIFTLDPLFHAGAYYVQEASSMFLDAALRSIFSNKDGLRVLDLCAAPGGKSTLIASFLGKSSLLISNEVIRSRASILAENMCRRGLMNTWVTGNDPRSFAQFPGYFDLIVADAPCSGSGLFRKQPDALDEWSEQNVALCSARQQRILADVLPALKQNGVLIYATCSFSRDEDEAILDFLAEDFGMETIALPAADSPGIVPVRSPKHKRQGYRFYPHLVEGEGFFIAALRKTDGEDSFAQPKAKKRLPSKADERAQELLPAGDFSFYETGDKTLAAIDAAHEDDFLWLREKLYFRRAGINLGAPAGKDWIPDHDAMMHVDLPADFPSIEVEKDAALRFLKKENFPLPETAPRGRVAVRYRGLALGGIKNLGNRFNNYLPKNWRIRMDIENDNA